MAAEDSNLRRRKPTDFGWGPARHDQNWDDPQAKDGLVPALVKDANVLVAVFADAELADDADAEFALALLALVAGQGVEPAEGSDGTDGRWRIARKVAPDRVVSTVDPDARHTRTSPENRQPPDEPSPHRSVTRAQSPADLHASSRDRAFPQNRPNSAAS